MTNISVIENRISLIKKYLKILENYKKYSINNIKNDLNIKGALERYLYLVIQATIDLAEATISFKDFRKPTSFSESFYILNEEKIISLELTEKMVKMTGFRNIVAHDYENIDYEIVYNVLQNRLIDIKQFTISIKNKILGRR